MSAEQLREAAAVMRSRAEGVTSGAEWSGGHYLVVDYDPRDPSGQTAMQRLIGGMDGPDAEHFSSWRPAVALAVADWLKSVAADVDKRDNPKRVGGRYEALRVPDERAALAVAKAYLESDR